MVTQKFTDAYQKLNPAQKEAVDSIEGPVMVVAGPGTGKTQILTLRIANILLKSQVNPENILALTFTESGVLAMRKRLVEMIGTPGYKVEINTFHSFCNEIIKKNPEDFPHFLTFENITEIEQIQLLEKIFSQASLEYLKPFGEPLYFLKAVLASINDLKKEGIDPESLKIALEKQKKDLGDIPDLYHQKGEHQGVMKGKYQTLYKDFHKTSELAILYQSYQEELKKQKLYDFNDMLLEVLKALQTNSELLLRVQETYQYILVDEHQDTNSAQNKLIEILASFYADNPNLFVVGDEKQAIFRFQGASLENFLYFQKLYPQAKLINLEDNYRSSQMILNAASSLIKQNITSEILAKKIELKAKSPHPDEKVKVAELSDFHGEYHFVARDIKAKIDQGVTLKEIAVLSRNNKDLLPLVEVFEQYQIPYNIESDQNVISDPQVRKLILLFRAALNLGSDLELINLLHTDFLKIDPLDVYKLVRFSNKERIGTYELLAGTKSTAAKEEIDSSLPLFSQVNTIQSKTAKAGKKKIIVKNTNLQRINLQDADKLLSLLQKLKKWKTISENENLETVFVTILRESGLLAYILQLPNSLEVLDKVSGLYEDIKMQTSKKPGFSLKDFLSYLDLLAEHDLMVKKVQTVLKNAVRIMTAHRSKGQEFDYVYIINSFDGHWGNAKKHARSLSLPWDYLGVKLNLDFALEENEDERRLFYVSLTRARKGILISYSTRSLDGKEQVPSQFIQEIEDNFKEKVDTTTFEGEFLSQKEILFAPRHPVGLDIKESFNLSLTKEFLKGIFLEKGLSATALNNYLSCPWKYFYRNLITLPDSKDKNLIFGSAIHKAINAYIRNSRFKTLTEQFLFEAYKEALTKETSVEGKDYAELLLKGEKVLKGFYLEEASHWPNTLRSELLIRGVKISDDVVLAGMLDLIEPLDNLGSVRVYDFKTGRPKSRNEIAGLTKSGSGDYLRQLIFYKILLDRYQQGRMKMQEGVINFIEPDDKGRYHKELFVIEDNQLKEMEELILKTTDEIINLSFWHKTCDDKDCQYCTLRELMG